MKKKKSIIIILTFLVLAVIVGIITYQSLSDSHKITSKEKKWMNEHMNTVLNVNVLYDVNIFGDSGTGVYYEFIHDLEKEYKLQINPVAYHYGESVSGLTLGVKTKLNENDFVFYQDHYVLVGKKSEVIYNYSDYANKRIGVINSELSYISSYLSSINGINLVGYQTEEELLTAMDEGEEIDYIVVPYTLYLDEILNRNYYIIHHLSDVLFYYTISGIKDDTLTSIMNKFYYAWEESNLDPYFKREEFQIFASSIGISETEIDAMQSVTYRYGFVDHSPYEVLMSGNFGGIIAMYLHQFQDFSGVEFHYEKCDSLNDLKKAINQNKVDLYFNYYHISDNFNSLDSNIVAEYSILANKKNSVPIYSMNSLIGKTVYAEKNSSIYTYLAQIQGIQIDTYESEKDLKKLNKKDVILIVDKNVYQLYADNVLSNYSERYSGFLNDTYDFKFHTNNTFYQLFQKYMMSLDSKEMINEGMYNHNLTVKTGSILGTIAKYILITVVAVFIVILVFYKSSKKIKIAKKIKKENKMKFIDQLTSLKNRNYLNEYIYNWNNNTIYPQTMIVIDLNNIQYINDTLGYEEGDKQIKAAANILIKTQLDNSDMMRTDGNEFLVYLVGYTQKQVTNYIHKINKEFKKLPYEYGAEFGYSMINDGVKTIEDAILEATDEMKKQKKNKEEEK